jgi:hypothetical protein
MKLKPIIAFFVCSLLIACTLPSYRHRNISVSIVEPLSGDIYFVGVPIDILANSYVDGANITERFFIFANSNRIGEIPALTDGPGAMSATLAWTPPSAGEYQIQAEALTSDNEDDRGGVSDSIKICVLDIPGYTTIFQSLGSRSSLVATNYSGPCPLPPQNPTNPNDVSFNMVADASPSTFAYPTDACPNLASVVRFTATIIQDPSDSVGIILAKFQGHPAIALSPAGFTPAGEKLYIGEWDIASLPSDFFDINGLTINWTVFAFSRTGALMANISGAISAAPCTPPAPGKPVDEIPTPTFTPASDADCGPGTYFAENTNQCIPIEIVTVKPDKDNSGQNACKDPGNCPYGWSQQNCSCK